MVLWTKYGIFKKNLKQSGEIYAIYNQNLIHRIFVNLN